jgi:menaquinone-dependent protoporphyrinogen oxidase
MKLMIIYATIEGQTRKIAERIAAHAEEKGHAAALMNVNAAQEFGLEKPDAVILAAPIHAARYPTPFVDFVHREKDWLNALPSAFVSVTLSIDSEHDDERAAAANFPETLKAETGWRPKAVHNAAGALRFTEYDFFKRWMMRRIAEAEGAPTDRGDVEFTDWRLLDDFVDAFLDLA